MGKDSPFPEGMTIEEMQAFLYSRKEYDFAYDLDNVMKHHDYDVLRRYFDGLKRGVSSTELWAGRFAGLSLREMRSIFAELSVWNRSYIRAKRYIDKLDDYLGKVLREKSLHKMESKVLAEIQAMPAAERDALHLCDFGSHFRTALQCEKSCNRTWAFEREFNYLKDFKNIHGWDNAFIEREFGVNFKQAKSLYYRLRN